MTMTTESAGMRTRSRITLTVDVNHDGDADLVAEHLRIDVAAVLERYGLDHGAEVDYGCETLLKGDAASASLPWLPER